MRTFITVACLVLCACFPKRVERQVEGVRVVTLQLDHSNAHLVITADGGALLVDSGLERNAGLLETAMKEAGVDPEKLAAIILTHGHSDHAGGAGVLRKKYGTRIIAGRGDAALFASGHNDALCPVGADARDRVESDQAEAYSPFEPDRWVDQATSLEALTGLQGVEGAVWPVAGHTPGSVVVRVGRAVLVGDLFRGAVFGSSAQPHFYMCDLAANRADIQRLLKQEAPLATTFFVGHFGPLTREAVEQTFSSSAL